MMDPKTFLEVPTDTSFMLLATSAAASADLLRGLTSAGVVVRTLRGRKMRERQTLMDEVGAALQFPSYFGENWDALDECLSDLAWMLPVTSLVLLVQDAEQVLADENPDQLQIFVSLLRDAMSTFAEAVVLGEVWDRPAVPFHVVLQADVEAAAAASQRWETAGASLKGTVQQPLEEFLSGELNDYIRLQLLAGIEQLKSGRRYFEYNTFNILLDADTSTVTVEDELDVHWESTLSFADFQALLRSSTGLQL